MSTAIPLVCQYCKRPIGNVATYIGAWPYHYECTVGPSATTQYAPQPLTEQRVREIVREELRREKYGEQAPGSAYDLSKRAFNVRVEGPSASEGPARTTS